MSDEIFFNGVRFISAQEAGEISNFTRDYVARLCRDGRVRGRRVGKNWYVDESALKELINELDPLIKKLPHELCEGMKSLDMEKPETMKAILRQVQPMLFTKLRNSEAIS